MEVETKRSVADYFVVAGLPKENPQLLDDFSLEANLKPSAYQDPITDIAVRVQQSPLEPVCCKKQQKEVPEQLLVCRIGDF